MHKYIDFNYGNRLDLGNEYLSFIVFLKQELSSIQSISNKIINHIIIVQQHSNQLINILQFKQMDLQTQGKQQIELKNLYEKNQQIFKKRADAILSKLSALQNQSGEANLLDNINFEGALSYINDTWFKKEKSIQYDEPDEEIDRQLHEEVTQQNNQVLQQIKCLNDEINQLNQKKQKYILTQSITSKQILQLDEIIAHNLLNLSQNKPSHKGQPVGNPGLQFAYDFLPNGSIKFKPEYTQLISHFLVRIKQNKRIINKLQSLNEQNVRKTQTTRFKIQKVRKINRELDQTVKKVQEMKDRNNNLKQQLRLEARKCGNQIQKRLSSEIDKKSKEISRIKQGYQKAYHSLLELIKRAIDNADLQKVTDYIKQT